MDAFEIALKVLLLIGVVSQITMGLRKARSAGHTPWRLVASTVVLAAALIGWTLALLGSIILLEYRWWPVAALGLVGGGWLALRLTALIAGTPKPKRA
jgi:hypothetical protein